MIIEFYVCECGFQNAWTEFIFKKKKNSPECIGQACWTTVLMRSVGVKVTCPHSPIVRPQLLHRDPQLILS